MTAVDKKSNQAMLGGFGLLVLGNIIQLINDRPNWLNLVILIVFVGAAVMFGASVAYSLRQAKRK